MDFNQFLEESCHRIAEKNLFSILTLNQSTQEASIESISGTDFLKQVNRVSKILKMSEVLGKKVYLLSENTLPLLITYFASLKNYCQVSIADIKLTAQEINQIINDFSPDVIIAETAKIELCRQLDFFNEKKTLLLELQELYQTPDDTVDSLVESKMTPQGNMSPQVIVYTSGTSGTAKGVVLDISAILFEAQSLKESFERDYLRRKCFSILPLNHVYGLTTAIFTSLWADQEVFLTQSLAPQHIRMIIQDHKPYYLYVVPQFLSLIKNKVFDSLSKKPPLTQSIAKWVFKINSRLRSRWIAEKFFSEIRNQIGNSLDFIISGGAPLDEDIFDFFEAIGIPICNGYGLTETGPVVCMNTLAYRRRGSVGKLIKGVKVKIDSQSQELLIAGPNLFKEYYQKPQMTAECLLTETTDNQPTTWFKTGDLGDEDAEGFLYIKGRSKSMIVLPSGKKVQPEEVELQFLKLGFIKNCCLVFAEDSKTKISKLFLVIELDTTIQLPKNEILEKLILQSHQLAGFKRPQGFKFSHEPLPLTTTLKVRRFMVEKNIHNYKE